MGSVEMVEEAVKEMHAGRKRTDFPERDACARSATRLLYRQDSGA